MTTLTEAVQRGQTTRAIRECVRCPLSSHSKPVVFRGSTPARYMLIGEAPDLSEDKYNRLWVGQMPRWMDEQFHAVGLPSIDQWVVANSVQCRPPDQRAPTASEIIACSSHVRSIIEFTNPEWVLTMGALALASTGVKGALKKFHGRPFLMTAGAFVGRWVLPTYDPRIKFRSDVQANDMINDLSTLSKLINGSVDVMSVACRVGRAGKLVLPE